ncbi:MAG TPA: diguanylate cyclase [Geobacterales bacterium]|nr:diguanylate cyclase [Geobacterales bacterium]
MSILVVDDSQVVQALMATILRDAGYESIDLVSTVTEAYRHLGIDGSNAGTDVELILMDVLMPDVDGIEACRRIKDLEELQDIPIIMVTGMEDVKHLQAAFAAGANDYITKPFRPLELLVRVRSALRLRDEMERRKSREMELMELTRQLAEANDKLRCLSSQDMLTGLANRRCLDDFLDREWKRAVREIRPVAVIMIDIDCFKAYNDAYGHQAGDECLQKVAREISCVVRRPGDLVARYGGEEFIAILPDTDLQGAVAVAETMRSRVERLEIKHKASRTGDHLTISLGVVQTSAQADLSFDALIGAADRALYLAKREGRNRIRIAGAPSAMKSRVRANATSGQRSGRRTRRKESELIPPNIE